MSSDQELYSFSSPLQQLIQPPRGSTLVEVSASLVAKLASRPNATWSDLPDIGSPPVDANVEFLVPPKVYNALRERDAPVVSHFTYTEGVQAVAFHEGKATVLFRMGH